MPPLDPAILAHHLGPPALPQPGGTWGGVTSGTRALILRSMRILSVALVLCLSALPAIAAPLCRGAEGLPEPGPAPALVVHQFHRSDAGLACVLPPEQGQAMAEHRRSTSFLPCLRVGAVAVADTIAQVEGLLGAPATIDPLGEGIEIRAYPINQRSVAKPYYAVTFRDKVAVAVQLLGSPSEMPASFSGLSLGDPVQAVVDTLGKPARRCVLRPNGPETWLWPAFPIGVDVADGRVVGLKATWPAGRDAP
jgi:hypothetical protein